MPYIAQYASPVGRITLAADAQSDALLGAWLAGQKHFPRDLAGDDPALGAPPVLRQAAWWLDRYFADQKPSPLELRLAPNGSEFQQQVWALLCEIPYGETTTYGQIARAVAKDRGRVRMSAQAVGGAVGRNPISIIIPCHRVVGADGSLTGYAGGVETKRRLLMLEAADMERLFVPVRGTAL